MRKWRSFANIDDPTAWLSVTNALPTVSGSYGPPGIYAQHVGAGPSSPGTTLRAWCALLPDDTATCYIGTTTKLYHYDGTSTFTDRSVGGGYTNTATDWSFAQYGNNTYATNRVDNIQSRDSSAGGGGSAFANLSGSPPKARILVTQADQLLLFDLNDGSEKPDAYAACAPGDPTDWSGAGATTATRIRHRPGKVRAAIAFRDYVLVFKRGSVYRLYYTGNSVFKWKLELLAINIGAWNMHSVVNCGDVVVFTGPGGGWRFDGSSFQSIAHDLRPSNMIRNLGVGSFYSQVSKRVYFHASASLEAYNIVSDAWGKSASHGTNGEIASTYRPLTGEPAALSAISSDTIGVTLPDVTWQVDLSTNPCVVKSTSYWGSGVGGVGASMQLIGTVVGIGGDQQTRFKRLIPQFCADLNVANTTTQPGNTGLTLSLYTTSTKDDIDFGTYVLPAAMTSATAQRRFDFNAVSPYILPQLDLYNNSGYTEIVDYEIQMEPAGKI